MVPDKTISDFVSRARDAAGANLDSIVLYGSAVAGDFHPDFSNLNFLCVLRDTSLVALTALHSLAKWWDAQKQPPPLLLTRSELRCSADVFPIELMDMLQNHRVLFGDDPFTGLEVSPHNHRAQVEYELREKLILLRRHITLAGGHEKRLQDLLLRSVPSIATLFRHALIATGNAAPVSKDEAVRALAKQVHFDPAAVESALDIRAHPSASRKLDVNDLLSKYLSAVEQVIAAVDQAVC